MKPRLTIFSCLSAPTTAGLFARAGLFVLLMLSTLALAVLFKSLFLVSISVHQVIAMFLVAGLPMLVGLILSEVPRGTDWLLFRLGIATFCRTGLPLLIVIVVIQLSKVGLADPLIGLLAFFYVVGFLASVWISINRIADTGFTDSVIEVDRAVV